MIEKQVLRKFVVGLGTNEEAELCESFLTKRDLAGNDSVVQLQLDQETVDDSLIQSLQGPADHVEDFEHETREINACIQARLETTDIVKFVHPPQADDEIGRIGDYRLLEKIGVGGMGIVFRAEHLDSNQVVALKVMNPLMASNPLAAERFQREVRSASKLNHDRIVKIHDVGTDAGMPYFAMEQLQGQTLGQLVEQGEKLPESEIKRIVLQIAEGLDYATSRGILHRDIKPDNLWLDEGGNVVILDFGLARGKDDTAGLTNTGDVLGTPRYMAPEQVLGKAIDHRTDLFSLGAVMYEMITGTSKFADANVYATMMAVTQKETTTEELTEQGCSAELANLTCRLLAKLPEQRPDSAAVVIREIQHLKLAPAKQPGQSRRNTYIASWLSLAMAAFLMVAAGIIIYLQTDKGTLVVEAGEGVEITAEKQGFKIRLVDSDKTYRVSIGSLRLPSGRYEIVVDDGSEELLFSSTGFVIRRGQKQVVEVTVKENESSTSFAREGKYAFVAKWFELDEGLFDENLFGLGTVLQTDGRDFLFKMNGTIRKTEEGFQANDSRMHYTIRDLFGLRIQVLRDGKKIGQANMWDQLPLKKGEEDYQCSFLGRLDGVDSGNVSVQEGDVLVVIRDGASEKMSIGRSESPDLYRPTALPVNLRELIAEEYPGIEKVFVGTVENVSTPVIRFKIDRCFDLTNKRPKIGEEYVSNGNTQVPAFDGEQVHLYAGSERIGLGRVTSLLGETRNSIVVIESPLAEDPRSESVRWVVIPVTADRQPETFDLKTKSLMTLPSLPIMEKLGLKPGDPLTNLAMVSQPSAKNSPNKEGLESWTIETRHHRLRINDIAINYSRELVAIGGDDAILRIWDLGGEGLEEPIGQFAPQLRQMIPCHWEIKRVCWSPGENIVAVATHDSSEDAGGEGKGKVLLWRMESNNCELIHCLDFRANELAFCPSGGRLAMQTTDRLIVTDLMAARPDTILTTPATESTRCAWSPDGKLIACTSLVNSQRRVLLLDFASALKNQSGEQIHVVKEFPNCHDAGFTALNNGDWVLTMIQDSPAGPRINTIGSDSLEQFSSVPMDLNSTVVFRENHETFFRIDIKVGANYLVSRSIHRATFDSSGGEVNSVQFENAKRDDSNRFLDHWQKPQFVVDGKLDIIEPAQFARTGKDDINIWLNNLSPVEHDATNSLMFQLSSAPGAKPMELGQISARNILNGQVVNGPEIRDLTRQTMLIQKGAIAASPDGKQLAFLGKDVVHLHDLESNETSEFRIKEITGNIPHLHWSHDSRYLIVQRLSDPGLTVFNPGPSPKVAFVKAEKTPDGDMFSDTGDQIFMDPRESNRVFWRHRSDGVGYFDISNGRKLATHIVQPRNEKSEHWIASYDWHPESGRVCLLVKNSMLETRAWLEILSFDGQVFDLIETIELDGTIAKNLDHEFVTFDSTADHLVLCSKSSDEKLGQNGGTEFHAFKVDWNTSQLENIGRLKNSNFEFMTNRRVVVGVEGSTVNVLSIDDTTIQSLPIPVDSLHQTRRVGKFGDQWIVVAGRQTQIFDENFELVSTALFTNPAESGWITISNEGSLNSLDENNDDSIEFLTIGIRDNRLVVEPVKAIK